MNRSRFILRFLTLSHDLRSGAGRLRRDQGVVDTCVPLWHEHKDAAAQYHDTRGAVDNSLTMSLKTRLNMASVRRLVCVL